MPDNVRERDSIARFRTDLRDYLLNLSQDPNTTPWWSSNDYYYFFLSLKLFLNKYCQWVIDLLKGPRV